MTSGELLHSLNEVAAHLPFELTDMQAANTLYARWRNAPSEADERLVDIWTYCFVRRYFLIKFAQSDEAADLEMIIEKVYRKIHRKRIDVRDPSRYAHWVHVVCCNTFRNHLRSRSRRTTMPIDHAVENTVLVEEPKAALYDAGTLHGVVHRSIAQLPGYLQEVAERRLLKEQSYSEIGEAIESPVPTVRSYLHKAVKRLREDPTIRAYLEEILHDG